MNEQPLPQSNLQPQPVAPTPPPKNNSGILIGIFLLFLGILVGLVIDKTTLLSTLRIPYLSVTPTPTLIPSPTPTPDPTANWKTYTNTKYNFSFLFPKEWESCMSQGTGSWLVSPGKCNPPYADYFIQISVLTNTNKVPDYSGPGDASAYSSSGKQTVTLGTNQFIKQKFIQTKSFTWNGKEYPAGPNVIFYDVVDTKNNQVIELYKSPDSITDEATIDQILSTFRFTEAISSESDQVRSFADAYAQTYVNGDWQKLKSLLTAPMASDMTQNETNLPVGGHHFTGYQIMSIEKNSNPAGYKATIRFFQNGQPVYNLPNTQNDPAILIVKENGEWKSMTWYLYQ